MANYLYIIASEQEESSIDNFLFSQGILEAEDLFKKLENGIVEYYVSKEVSNHIYEGGRIFQGYCINYIERTVNYSAPQSNKDLQSGLEGCYFSIENSGSKILISNDYFSQLPILFFANKNYFACSDSLYVLFKLRKALGLSVDLDISSIKSRAWINSITNQLLSDRTPLSAIKYLPPHNSLEINITDGKPHTKIIADINSCSQNSRSYTEATRSAAINIRSVISSLLNSYPLSLSLSGGLDSRVILAGAIKNKSTHNLNVGTNENLHRDLEVVKGLSKKFGFEYNSREKFSSTKTKNIDQLSTYVLLSCGIYDSIYCPKRVPAQSVPIPITGHGAEIFKGNYGLRSIEGISNDCPFNRNDFLSELRRGQDRLHVKTDPESSGEAHYFGYRNSLHGARSTIFSLYAIRPLMQKALAEFFMKPNNPLAHTQRKTVVHDLLILLSPELASFDFDVANKNISKDYIDDRLSFLGGIIEDDELISFEVLGSPNEKGHALSSFFLQLASRDGYSGTLDLSDLTPLLSHKVVEIVPELTNEVEYWLEFVEKLNSNIDKKESHNIAIGKILSANIFWE